MDQYWLANLDQNTAVLVPTRSLANTLNEQVAQYYIAQQKTVWEAPNILIWGDYIRELWHSNRDILNQVVGAQQLISSQQSLLLWTQVVEASRREEQELTLLNVQQTARAVQRSWALMQDWQIDIESVQQDHVADTQQFIVWLKGYQQLLRKRGLIDEPLLVNALCSGQCRIAFAYSKLVWYAYDLITAAQSVINQRGEMSGIVIERRYPHEQSGNTAYHSYLDTKSELRSSLLKARDLLEQDKSTTINIVVHDLQDRQAQVQELAREVFYPAASPLEVQQGSTVYRFSLGQRLSGWAAIETALSVIALLKNRVTSADLSFLLRNQFLGLSAQHRAECRLFDRWLKRQRMRNVLFDNLPNLYEQCLQYLQQRNQGPETTALLGVLVKLVDQRQGLLTRLSEAKDISNFATLSFIEWVGVFSEWLDAWGWSTRTAGNELNTVQHQLLNRWQDLLAEFAGLAAVQRQTGIRRAIELLQQMARDTMFLPKAVASPVLISSILEAIGRPADYCFLAGMNDAYPPAPKSDAFIPQRLLAESGHPDMTADSSFLQADIVARNLLRSVKNSVISYAHQDDQDREIKRHCSPLFRGEKFDFQDDRKESSRQSVHLHQYVDTRGPAWVDPGLAKGGSKIFENQSHCAFKAFVTHQLGFQADDEAEFGLDHLDRGNIVHYLLDLVWAELQTQAQLREASGEALSATINRAIDATLTNQSLGLSNDKQTLLVHERPRLFSLLHDWLEFEKTRPESFAVIEREEERFGEISGIQFKYIIDRLDMIDDGRTFIIDYKTGLVNRNDWIGEPIKSPQMPLYAVALDKVKSRAVSGIVYANVRQYEHSFIELSEAGVFRKATRYAEAYEESWLSSRGNWESVFARLAEDFLIGEASVNPIDDAICNYCDLQAVCRVSQLRQARGGA